MNRVRTARDSNVLNDEDEPDIQEQQSFGDLEQQEGSVTGSVDKSSVSDVPKFSYPWYPSTVAALCIVLSVFLSLSAAWYGRVVDPYGVIGPLAGQLLSTAIGAILLFYFKYKKAPAQTNNPTKPVFADSHYDALLEFYLGSILVSCIAIVLLSQWEVNYQAVKTWLDEMKPDKLSTSTVMMRGDYVAAVYSLCFAQAWLFTKFWAACEREHSPIYYAG